jgi:hypothetical protein
MPRTKSSYPMELVELSKSAILELWRGLHKYRDAIVLIGGWVPYFILEKYGGESYNHDHIGYIDIDIAINTNIVSEEKYKTMEAIVLDLGYRQKRNGEQNPIPFVFEKTFSDEKFTIEVDFVGSYYGAKGHRHHRVSGLLARKCHGVDIAFDHYFEENIKGTFPTGGKTEEIIKIADIVGSLTMKGIVLGERYKEKDAYDIYYLISNYKNGPKDVANEINKHASDSLVKESLDTITRNFENRDSVGPTWVADFLDETEGEREKKLTDVHMSVTEFLKHTNT